MIGTVLSINCGHEATPFAGIVTFVAFGVSIPKAPLVTVFGS